MSGTEKHIITEEFKKIIRDFVGDIKTTFPEYNSLIAKWWKECLTTVDELNCFAHL